MLAPVRVAQFLSSYLVHIIDAARAVPLEMAARLFTAADSQVPVLESDVIDAVLSAFVVSDTGVKPVRGLDRRMFEQVARTASSVMAELGADTSLQRRNNLDPSTLLRGSDIDVLVADGVPVANHQPPPSGDVGELIGRFNHLGWVMVGRG